MKKLFLFIVLVFLPKFVDAKISQFYCEGEWQWKWFRGSDTEFALEPHERDMILNIDIKNKIIQMWEIESSSSYVEEKIYKVDDYFISFKSVGWDYQFSRHTGRLTIIYSDSYFHKIRYRCVKNFEKII